MAQYEDKYWWAADGLRLHYRDYAADAEYADRPPLLCLHGLTRNARDYASFADRYAGKWRVICPEMRGRAESAYAKDPMTYVPLTYVQDVERLLTDLALNLEPPKVPALPRPRIAPCGVQPARPRVVPVPLPLPLQKISAWKKWPSRKFRKARCCCVVNGSRWTPTCAAA